MTQLRCSVRVFTGERGGIGGHMCGKPGSVERDGKIYCKFHDPPAVAERKTKLKAKWDAESAARNLKWKREAAQYEALKFVEKLIPTAEDNPGISDLDDEQPMHLRCTLGEVRAWRLVIDGLKSQGARQ